MTILRGTERIKLRLSGLTLIAPALVSTGATRRTGSEPRDARNARISAPGRAARGAGLALGAFCYTTDESIDRSRSPLAIATASHHELSEPRARRGGDYSQSYEVVRSAKLASLSNRVTVATAIGVVSTPAPPQATPGEVSVTESWTALSMMRTSSMSIV